MHCDKTVRAEPRRQQMARPGSLPAPRLLLLAGGLVTLVACAPSPPEIAEPDRGHLAALHQAQVEAISSWQLHGKVSILRDGKLWRAGLNWLHAEDSDRINLLSSGGRTLMRLQHSQGAASAIDNRGRTYHAASFRELVAKTLDADVPMEHLQDWVVGKPGASSGLLSLNQDGSLAAFQQAGWEVRYMRYQSVQHLLLGRLMLPTLLVLTRDDLKLTVSVQRWQLLRFKASVEEMI